MICPACSVDIEKEGQHKAGCRYYDRMTGKTTRLIERAINLTGDGHDVYITGAHTHWLLQLHRAFHNAGLKGVTFVTIGQIKNGYLRGRRGILLIDDEWDLSYSDWQLLMEEKRYIDG